MSANEKMNEAAAQETPATTEGQGEAQAAGNGGADPVESLLDEIQPDVEALIAERDELRDRLMRALAEVENVRKRAERERREAAAYGGQKLASDLLAVYDNLNRALEHVDEETRKLVPGLIEGIELTRKEILSVFERHGIKPVMPQVGEKFDPELHQAMFEAPVPDHPAGNIIQVMLEGFTIGDRLMRPAQVGVSSTPASQAGGNKQDG